MDTAHFRYAMRLELKPSGALVDLSRNNQKTAKSPVFPSLLTALKISLVVGHHFSEFPAGIPLTYLDLTFTIGEGDINKYILISSYSCF